MKRRGLTSTVGFRVRTKFKELSARRAGVSPLLRFLCVPLERVKNLPPGCAADGVSWIDALHTLSTCLAGRNSRLLGPKKQNSGSVSTEIRPCFAFTCSFCFLRSFSFFSLTVSFFFDGRGGRYTAFSRWGSFQFRNYAIWTRVRLTRAVVRAVEVCCFVFCVWVCVCAVLPVRCRATKERVVIHKAAYITVHSRAAEIKLERLPIWCFGFDLVGASASFRGWKEQNDLACLPQTTRPPRQWPFEVYRFLRKTKTRIFAVSRDHGRGLTLALNRHEINKNEQKRYSSEVIEIRR